MAEEAAQQFQMVEAFRGLRDIDCSVREDTLHSVQHACVQNRGTSFGWQDVTELPRLVWPLLLDESRDVRVAAQELCKAAGWKQVLRSPDDPCSISGLKQFLAACNSFVRFEIAAWHTLHIEIVLELLTDEDLSTRQRAGKALETRLNMTLARLSSTRPMPLDQERALLSCCNWLHGGHYEGQVHLRDVFSTLPALCLEQLARWKDEEGNTLLHKAAAIGWRETCEVLVDFAGLSLRAQNHAGQRPLALAKNRAVDKFLRSRMCFQQTRFGHGNAYNQMVRDDGKVNEVAWYTVPLPGAAGHLGGLHSIIVVTTISDAGRPSTTYILEKANAAGVAPHQKHGIFVGSQELSTNLRDVNGIREWKVGLSTAKQNLKAGLKMKRLYEEAHNTGPYDLASSNCHHAAKQVFNYCCVQETDHATRRPNEVLAPIAALFSGIFSGSRCASEFESARSESDKTAGCNFAKSPTAFTKKADLRTDDLAKCAAEISHTAYASACGWPEVAATVLIYNKLARPVRVYYDHCVTGLGDRLEPEQSWSAEPSGDRANVEIYAVAWTPGCFSHRLLAPKQPVWRGHVYDLVEDFRGEVVLEDVTMEEPIEVLHTTRKADSRSPVQWLLARSGEAVYLCFRGTADVQDVAIDISAVPDFGKFSEHEIGVHGGMAHTLEQVGGEVEHVVNSVLEMMRQHRRAGEQLVLCGHSLGGGYAQVMAVHLLSRDVPVSAVCTFGALHVLVPPGRGESQLWQRLQAITQHWVHAWDPVPRLPLCRDWLVDVLPKLKCEVLGGGIKLGMAHEYVAGLQRNYNAANAQMLEKYDVVGEILMVSLTSDVAYCAPESAGPLKELLAQKPPESVMTWSKLPAYHSMSDYVRIVRKCIPRE